MSETKKTARGKLKRAVQKTAPELAGALGGPLAGAAVEAISRAIFGDGDVDAQTIEKTLRKMQPEHYVALRRAETEFLIALAEAGADRARIAAADRADARARHVAMRDWTPAILGSFIVAGFFIVLAAMVTRRLPDGAESEFAIMLGALAAMTAAVVNYYFGSSAGSKEKTEMLAEASLAPSRDGAAAGALALHDKTQ